ncbi:MAG: hypothetical protein IJX30_05230 [Clostridia bacterium]|nr:hypothetical protein [Clostridia bacterium]
MKFLIIFSVFLFWGLLISIVIAIMRLVDYKYNKKISKWIFSKTQKKYPIQFRDSCNHLLFINKDEQIMLYAFYSKKEIFLEFPFEDIISFNVSHDSLLSINLKENEQIRMLYLKKRP